uniref:Uncharacterized protein n=1 Tax=Rhizophora mucronata TaxID=61149 RepID=A0A2P2QF74_RHIMU
MIFELTNNFYCFFSLVMEYHIHLHTLYVSRSCLILFFFPFPLG